MEQVTKLLHFVLNSLHNLLLLAHSVEPLDELLPVNQLINAEITEI